MRRSVMAAAILMWTCLGAAAQETTPPAIGPETAGAQFEVFLSFSDDASARLAVVLDALRERHPDDVRVTFRHLPPENDQVAALPHRAAVAADRQQRFWDMARVLFANQGNHNREDLIGMARQLRLDVDRFTADLDDPTVDTVITADRARATEFKSPTAPVVMLNGVAVTGEYSVKRFETLIHAAH